MKSPKQIIPILAISSSLISPACSSCDEESNLPSDQDIQTSSPNPFDTNKNDPSKIQAEPNSLIDLMKGDNYKLILDNCLKASADNFQGDIEFNKDYVCNLPGRFGQFYAYPVIYCNGSNFDQDYAIGNLALEVTVSKLYRKTSQPNKECYIEDLDAYINSSLEDQKKEDERLQSCRDNFYKREENQSMQEIYKTSIPPNRHSRYLPFHLYDRLIHSCAMLPTNEFTEEDN